MKQIVLPNKAEIDQLKRFVDTTMFGHLQIADGPLKYGIKKSLFYYEPDSLPKDTYDKNFQKPLSHCFYKKGKIDFESTYTYQDSLQTSFQAKSKNIVIWKYEFGYNDKNLLDTQKWYGKKDKLRVITTLTYTYRQ